MVDDFYGYSAGLRPVEGAGGVAVEGRPGAGVDLCFQGCLEGFVRVTGSQEVGVPHEEALFVVVGVYEPARDAVCVVAPHLSGVGMEYVYAVYFYPHLSVFSVENVYVRFAEDDEEVALPGVLEVVGHVEVGVYAGFEDGYPAEPVELGGVGFVVEGARDEDIEVRVSGFAGGTHEVGARDGSGDSYRSGVFRPSPAARTPNRRAA